MGIHELCPGCMRRIREEQVQSGCPYCGYRPPAPGELAPHILAPYTVLEEKYMIGRTLGAGGCGITYLGYDLNLELRIAIKEYYPVGFVSRDTGKSNLVISGEGDKSTFFEDGKKKYIQEARMLARFSGLRNIVSVRDYFEENHTCYIIMEYLDGETLKSYLTRRGGRLSCDEMMRMLQPLLASLNEVHQQGMIHRDISPDNIMILKDGTLKLLDFGSARDMAGNADRSASVMLKPGYAPEEQYRIYGEQGTWTDVYALCATIYRCLTGHTPVDALSRKEHDTLIPPSQYGAALTPAQEAALLKGMAVNAAQRYKTLGEFYQGFYCNKIPGAQVMPAGQGMARQAGAGQRIPQQMLAGQRMVRQAGAGQRIPQQMPASQGMAQQAGAGQRIPQQMPVGQGMAQQAGAGQRTPQQMPAGQGMAQQAGAGQSIPQQMPAGQGMVQQAGAGQSIPQQMAAARNTSQWGMPGQGGLSYPEYQVTEHSSYILQPGGKKHARTVRIVSVLAAAVVLAIVAVISAFSSRKRGTEEDAAWAQGELAREENEEDSIGGQDDPALPGGLPQDAPGGEPSGDVMRGLSQSLGGDPVQQTNGPRLCYEIPEEFVERTEGFFYAPDYPSDTSNINIMTADNDSVTFQFTQESYCDMLERFYSEYYDVQVDVECTEFTKTTINGYNALIIRLKYDLMGVTLEQIQCAVETEKDKVTTITMSQPAGSGWENAFDRVLDSLRVE